MFKNIDKQAKLCLKDLVDYRDGQIVSRTLVQNNFVSMTLFSFDKNEEISTHAAGGDAKEFVDYVLSSPENTVKFIFDNRCYIETGNDSDNCYGDSKDRNYGEAIVFEKGN